MLGNTPLHWVLTSSLNENAPHAGLNQIFQVFCSSYTFNSQFSLEHGADVLIQDQYGCTAFELAVKFGLSRLFGMLLKKGRPDLESFLNFRRYPGAQVQEPIHAIALGRLRRPSVVCEKAHQEGSRHKRPFCNRYMPMMC